MKLSLKSAVSALIVGTALLSSNAVAQNDSASGINGSQTNNVISDGSAGRVTLQNTVGHAVAVPFGPRMNLTGSFGDGPGYDANLFSVNAFIPNHIDPGRSLFFESVRGTVTFDGNGVGNVGFGYRQYSPTYDRVFGVSGWGTVDDAHTQTYYRAGASLESRGKYLDYFLNGYVIVGDDSRLISDVTFDTPVFGGNYIGLPRNRIEEFAYSGFDFETGGPLPMLGRYGVSAYLGLYYRTTSNFDDLAGVSVRVDANVTEDVNVGVRYTQDDVFGAQTYATVNLAMPAGPPANWFKPRRVRDRLNDPVQRDTRIATHIENFATFSPLLDPTTMMPIFVQHLDPDAPDGGTGTFLRPAGSIDDFVNTPGTNIVFVSAGEMSPDDLNGELVLFPGQRLLSEAVSHSFLGKRTVDGPVEEFDMPGFNPDAPFPTLMNTTGQTIVMGAGFNEVSGFIFDGTQDDETMPLASGYVNPTAAGFDVNRNIFVDTRRASVVTVVDSGFGIYELNAVFGAGDESDQGLVVAAAGPGTTLELRVAGNEVIDVTGPNEDVNDNFKLDPGEDVNGNGILDRGTAIEVDAVAGATINADDPFAEVMPTGIFDNLANDNGQGIIANANGGGTINSTWHGNVALRNQFDGAAINTNTGGTITAAFGPLPEVDDDDLIEDIVIVEEDVAANAILDPFTPDNTFDNNGTSDVPNHKGSGLHIRAFDGGTVVASIEDTQLNDNGFAGLAIEADEGTVGLMAERNRIARPNAGAEGVHFLVKESTTVAIFQENEITGTPPTLDEDGNLVVDANGDVIGNTDLSFGIGGKASGGTFMLTVGGPEEEDGNVFSGNAEAAIGLRLTGETAMTGVSATFSIQNNLIEGTVDPLNFGPMDEDIIIADEADFLGDGIRLLLFDSSVLEPSLIADNTITGNEGYGVSATAREDSTIDSLTILRNEISENGNTVTNVGGGVEIVREGNAMITSAAPGMRGVNIIDNEINNNVGIGVFLRAIAGGETALLYNVINNEIMENDLEGIRIEAESDVFMDIDIAMNWIVENGSDGISYTGIDFASVTGTWGLNSIIENGQNLTVADVVTASMQSPITDGATGSNDLTIDVSSVSFTMTTGGNGIFLDGNVGFNIDDMAPPDANTIVDPLIIGQNLIDGNRLDGINVFMNGGGFIAEIVDNEIINNFIDGVDVFGAGALVDILFAGNLVGIDSHDVARPNGGDGVQFQNFADIPLPFGLFEITMAENVISYNGTDKADPGIAGGRGIDILNKTDGQSEYTIVGNDISNNWFSGVYVMNTADPGQLQLGPADPLSANGDTGDVPITQLHFIENNVDGNGLVGVFPDANTGGFDFETNPTLFGLAIRVGTSDGFFITTADLLNPDGFPDDEYASDGRGGIVAEVVDNTFSGNAGEDVYIDSFVSTVDPIVNDPADDPIQYDPLARLDLRFIGNMGDSLDVTNSGASYNNSDQFKSPSPPFNSTSRDRNAQRLPFLITVATGSVTQMTFEGTVQDESIDPAMPMPVPTNTFLGDQQLPDIDDYFDGRPLTFTAVVDDMNNMNGAIIGQTRTIGDYTSTDDERRFTFFPPNTFVGFQIFGGDTFEVTRTPQADNFDVFVFDTASPANPITADGALNGGVVSFTSGAIGANERAVISDFFGGIQDDTGSIFLSSSFSTAPMVGDDFVVQVMAPGMGPSTFRVETVDPDGTGLEDGFEFTFDGFVLDDVDLFAPFDIYGLPLGEARGVAGINQTEVLPYGWTPILPPETIDFSNFPVFPVIVP